MRTEAKPKERTVRVWEELLRDDMIARVGVYAYAVYSIIVMRANWQTGLSYPSHEEIKQRTGITCRETIVAAVEKLKDNAYITYEFRKPTYAGKEYGRKRYYYTIINLPTGEIAPDYKN